MPWSSKRRGFVGAVMRGSKRVCLIRHCCFCFLAALLLGSGCSTVSLLSKDHVEELSSNRVIDVEHYSTGGTRSSSGMLCVAALRDRGTGRRLVTMIRQVAGEQKIVSLTVKDSSGLEYVIELGGQCTVESVSLLNRADHLIAGYLVNDDEWRLCPASADELSHVTSP